MATSTTTGGGGSWGEATLDPNSIVDYLGSKGQATDLASRGKLYDSTFGSAGGTYTGSSAQNMALLTKLKGGYSGTTNPKSISGSASVGQNQSTTSALKAAAGSLNPSSSSPSTASSNKPVVNDTGIVAGAAGSNSPAQWVNPMTTPLTPDQLAQLPPALQANYTQTQDAFQQAQEDSSVSFQPVLDTYNENLATLNLQKTQALAGAKASYAKANPYGQGSDQDEFMSSISQGYDTQIENLQTQFSDAQAQNIQSLSDNINSIKTQSQANFSAWQQSNYTDAMEQIKTSPPTPIDLSDTSPKGQQNAFAWGQENAGLIQQLLNSGQYSDIDSVIGFLSQPTAGYVTEQTSISRASSAAILAGAASENASTNEENAGSTTTTSKPSAQQQIENFFTGEENTSTTVKIPAGSSGNSSNPAGLSLPNWQAGAPTGGTSGLF